MKIIRVKDSEIIDYLKEHFIEDAYCTKETLASEIKAMMKRTPEDVYVAVVISDYVLMGYAIAWLPVNRNYIWFSQAWKPNAVPDILSHKVVDNIMRWGKERGYEKIRMGTHIKPEKMQRAYGFKLIFSILERNL